MAASMLGCRKPLVGTGLAISLVLYMYELRNLASDHVGPPLLAVKLFSWPKAVTIDSLLDQSGCDLSHESAQDGCSDTCVMLEASKPMHVKWK